MDSLKTTATTEAWTPDALAKRLFLFVVLGLGAYMIAILAAMSATD